MRISDWSSDVCSYDLITQTIVRAAIAEILFLDVKPHAAVDLAVESAARDSDAQHFKSLVNALLRRLLREGDEARAGIDSERSAQTGRASCRERVFKYVYISVVSVSLHKNKQDL